MAKRLDWWRWKGAVLSALLCLSCSQQTGKQHPQSIVSPRSSVGPVAAEKQRPGDPDAGYRALTSEPIITCGIPYAAYKKTARPPAKNQLLPGREGVNAELPYDRTYVKKANGAELVVPNCLTCHAGFFNDQLIIGLGNESLDFTGDASAAAEAVGAYVSGEADTAEWKKWADRLAAVSPYTRTNTVGPNPAIDLTWALIAHRDRKTLAWSPKPLLQPPLEYTLPVSMPPWWRMKTKHAMFYTASGRGDHARHMILGSVFCADSVEEARAVDAYAPDIRAYIAALDAPRYPFAVDKTRAQSGRQVFEANCARCHGRHGENGTYPNLVIALGEVGTDPALAAAGTAGADDRFMRWVNESFYGELGRLAPAPGYNAPPLDGVWATAPYLHNGSVPSLEALLDSPKRPAYWIRSFQSSDYNQQTLGWSYTHLAYGKRGAKSPDERKRIYDTTLPGYSNKGHIYADALSVGERLQLLEYIKTL
ncbi:MAG: c-type cytochrome [Gammaproteobacteria bacterium]